MRADVAQLFGAVDARAGQFRLNGGPRLRRDESGVGMEQFQPALRPASRGQMLA